MIVANIQLFPTGTYAIIGTMCLEFENVMKKNKKNSVILVKYEKYGTLSFCFAKKYYLMLGNDLYYIECLVQRWIQLKSHFNCFCLKKNNEWMGTLNDMNQDWFIPVSGTAHVISK